MLLLPLKNMTTREEGKKGKTKPNKETTKKGKGRTTPRPRTLLADGPVSLLLAWMSVAQLCLPGCALLECLHHMCAADWMPLSNKMNYRGSLWCKLDALSIPINFQALCLQPKPVLNRLAREPVAE